MGEEDKIFNSVAVRRRGAIDDVESGSASVHVGWPDAMPMVMTTTTTQTAQRNRIAAPTKKVKRRHIKRKHVGSINSTLSFRRVCLEPLRVYPKTTLILVNLILFLYWSLFCLRQKINQPEPTFQEMLWKTLWQMPGMWFRAKFIDPLPSRPIYKYIASDAYSLLSGLDGNTNRQTYFMNKAVFALRFSATDFTSPTSLNRPKVIAFGKEYPNVGHMIEANQIGQASLLTTQIRILLSIVKKSTPYFFFFQDDAVFLTKHKEWPMFNTNIPIKKTGKKMSFKYVEAPGPVDVVFLAPNVTQAVKVTRGMIRVLNGTGAYAMIITNRGAQRLLEYLKHGSCFEGDDPVTCKTDDLDAAMMKYAQHYAFEIYLPSRWPLVRQSLVKGSMSTLLDKNYIMR